MGDAPPSPTPHKHAPPNPISCDAPVVGAGLSGIASIYKLRKAGLNVKCFEAGDDFGGVWHWNKYPGARTDSEVPFYQLAIPSIYQTWTFTERFPGQSELLRYFSFLSTTLSLHPSTYFQHRVVSSTWSSSTSQWTVTTSHGAVATCKYLILCTGLLNEPHIPALEGIHHFQGEILHSGRWRDGFSAQGKKLAIIGAGATGIQLTQELGKQADALTVFVRRPTYCLPMQQRALTETEQAQQRAYYPMLFEGARKSPAGFPIARVPCAAMSVGREEREAHFERTWKAGGFQFLVGNYMDVTRDKEANKAVYEFWAGKVRERLRDEKKQEIMAPKEMPYYFSSKITPLEQDYFEVLDRENVRIHDLGKAPLERFTERGLTTADGEEHEFDAVVLATGFDSITGSLRQMGIKDEDGVPLTEVWKDGAVTYLGLMIPGFPNMFLVNGPHCPSAHGNAPPIIEAQTDMIADIVNKVNAKHASSIEPTRDASDKWKHDLVAAAEHSLVRHTSSWWNGGNVAGRLPEVMTYMKGIQSYDAECRTATDDLHGFEMKSGNGD